MKTLKVKRSLAETHPDIARQWHPTKNLPLTPEDVTYGSSRKAWWVCDKSHEWKTTVRSRTQGSGCPECYADIRGDKIAKGALRKRGSLADNHPDIARQWHPTKNLPLTPNDVSPGSKKKAWWVCDKGHDEWLALISNRTRKKPSGCPECGYKTVGIKRIKAALRRSGSLAEAHPDIARQWHPTKNLPLTPNDVSPGSNKKAWWVCDKGHDDWLTMIKNRTKKKPSGCPECGKEKARERLDSYFVKSE